MLLASAPAPKKPVSTDDKVLRAFEESADPIGLEILYVHKDQIAATTGTSDGTLSNALTRLCKTGKIHRQMIDGKEVRGYYGIGPAPPRRMTDHAPPHREGHRPSSRRAVPHR
ncbi:hypothetical protein ACF07T_40200 [Streptomyces sp. NPDC015184]|uniref:hypothetical protein n=1 Tax=Streptomyces sp. NPDC015184 TaxID=3364946 RepID=UPI0036FDD5CE